MATQRFRLNTKTLALSFADDGTQIAVEIPAGAEVLVNDPVPIDPASNHTERINVRWNDRTASIFLIDLQERGLKIRA